MNRKSFIALIGSLFACHATGMEYTKKARIRVDCAWCEKRQRWVNTQRIMTDDEVAQLDGFRGQKRHEGCFYATTTHNGVDTTWTVTAWHHGSRVLYSTIKRSECSSEEDFRYWIGMHTKLAKTLSSGALPEVMEDGNLILRA